MIAILTTHPIQYQVPIWRRLAAKSHVPLVVMYLSNHGSKSDFDPGFGTSFAWDIDLLSGYPHEFIDAKIGPNQDKFTWLRLRPGFGRMLKERGVRVLWVQGWQVVAYWQAIREAKKAGIEVWLRGESNSRSNKGGLKQSLKWKVLRLLLDKVDRFLAIGRANRQFYLDLGYPDSKILAAPYCVENERFSAAADALRPDRAQLRQEWGIPADAFCFAFVGKFVAKKNPLDLAKAALRVAEANPGRKVHVLWVGSGELAEEIRAYFNTGNDGSTSGATFAGFLNQSQIARAYVAADALVLPSNAKETWGLVVNEAMAAGLPCVVSASCGCSEDLVEALDPRLRFREGDVADLTRALQAVMERAPTIAELRRKIADYSIDRTVETAERLYLESCEEATADAI